MFVVPMLQTRGTSNLRDFDLLSNVIYDSSTSLTISLIILDIQFFFMYQNFIIILLNENSSLSMNYESINNE